MKFEEASIEIDLEEVLKLDDNGIVILPEAPSLKEIEVEFNKISKRAKINLPPSVKNKYIESMQAMKRISMDDTYGESLKAINQNPFLNIANATNINLAGSKERVLENQRKMKDKLEEVRAIFRQTQDDIIAMLSRRIKLQPKGKKQYEAMQKRVSSIRFSPPSVNPFVYNKDCPAPNAFYNSKTHSFTVNFWIVGT